MEANEFMVGDWATITLRPMKEGKFTRQLDLGDLSFFVEFEPVPLTGELLMKNGFVPNKKVRSWYFRDGSVYISWGVWGRALVSSFGKKFGNRMNFDCHYVHELQQALRLFHIEKEIVL